MSEENKQLLLARAAAGGRPFVDWASKLSANPPNPMVPRNSAPGSIQRHGEDVINAGEGLHQYSKDPQTGFRSGPFEKVPTNSSNAAMAQRVMAKHGDPYLDYDEPTARAGGNHPNISAGAHYGDAYKQPNHPTFSTGAYLSQPAMMGGVWRQQGEKQYSFTPSRQNLENMPGNQLPTYFATGERQGTRVNMPDGNPYEGLKPYGEGIAPKTRQNPNGQTSPYELRGAPPAEPGMPQIQQNYSLMQIAKERAANNPARLQEGQDMGPTSPRKMY